MRVGDFRELQVYQRAFQSQAEVFGLTKRFPTEERYSLTDQVRRSSRSVCANIAEAWRKRCDPAAFVSKLSDADTEAVETQVWLDIAHGCDYIDDETHQHLVGRYSHLCAQLAKMMATPEQWCPPRQPTRDDA